LYSNLSLEYKNLTEQYNNLKNMYKSLRRENEEYKNILVYYEAKYNLSLERKQFLNKNFNYDFSYQPFINIIREKCVSNSSLNIPCAVSILKNKYGYKYISDIGDVLESVEEFISRNGGDCEDWSLFVAALINYFKNTEEIKYISSFENANGQRFYIYEENNILYYYQDAAPKYINLDKYKYTNVICYIINQTYGHCVLALSSIYLNPLNMDSAEVFLIEPQNGEYLGTLEELKKENIINIIINEQDIYYRQFKWDLWK